MDFRVVEVTIHSAVSPRHAKLSLSPTSQFPVSTRVFSPFFSTRVTSRMAPRICLKQTLGFLNSQSLLGLQSEDSSVLYPNSLGEEEGLARPFSIPPAFLRAILPSYRKPQHLSTHRMNPNHLLSSLLSLPSTQCSPLFFLPSVNPSMEFTHLSKWVSSMHIQIIHVRPRSLRITTSNSFTRFSVVASSDSIQKHSVS